MNLDEFYDGIETKTTREICEFAVALVRTELIPNPDELARLIRGLSLLPIPRARAFFKCVDMWSTAGQKETEGKSYAQKLALALYDTLNAVSFLQKLFTEVTAEPIKQDLWDFWHPQWMVERVCFPAACTDKFLNLLLMQTGGEILSYFQEIDRLVKLDPREEVKDYPQRLAAALRNRVDYDQTRQIRKKLLSILLPMESTLGWLFLYEGLPPAPPHTDG